MSISFWLLKKTFEKLVKKVKKKRGERMLLGSL